MYEAITVYTWFVFCYPFFLLHFLNHLFLRVNKKLILRCCRVRRLAEACVNFVAVAVVVFVCFCQIYSWNNWVFPKIMVSPKSSIQKSGFPTFSPSILGAHPGYLGFPPNCSEVLSPYLAVLMRSMIRKFCWLVNFYQIYNRGKKERIS